MVNRLKPLNLVDFTGGVNLRPETFQLEDNEMPELLNMEVDPRGGLNTRKGWTGINPPVVNTGETPGYLNPTVGTVSSPATDDPAGQRRLTADPPAAANAYQFSGANAVVGSGYSGPIYSHQYEAINRTRLVFPGVSGNYLSTASTQSGLTAVEVVARVGHPWRQTIATVNGIVNAGTQRFVLRRHTSGQLQFYVQTQAAAFIIATANVPAAWVDGQMVWLRGRCSIATGTATVTLEWASDAVTEPTTGWTQIATITGAATTISDTGTNTYIGRQDATALVWTGRVARVIVRPTIGGAAALDVSENNAGGMTGLTFPATTGQTVTVTQTAGNTIVQPQADTMLWRFDAHDYSSGTSYTDPRGRTWTLSTAGAIVAKVPPAIWDPRNAYAHTSSNGTRSYFMVTATANGTNGQVYGKVGLASSYTPLFAATCNAVPHLADFVSWGDDVYTVCGSVLNVMRYTSGGGATQITAAASGNWQNDYSAPGAADTFPRADLVTQSHGYMFVAGTTEDTVRYPNRIRWSHPNNPLRWAQSDYIDITDGGQRITAIASFSDRLLIFKPDSTWALFGYDADTWEVANVSRSVGCLNQQCIATNETAVFFLSWPQGIFGYTDKGVTELSVPIRSIFQGLMDADSIDNSWLGWMGRRLWCSLPYNSHPPSPTDAQTVFVFDPTLSQPGSWMMFRGGDDCVPGPYMERLDADQNTPLIAFSRQYPYMIQLEAEDAVAQDTCVPGDPMPFDTVFRTKWIDAGAPTWKKSWRRPDFLLRGLTFDTKVNVQVFHDFDAYNAERSFMVQYTPDNSPAIYTATGLPDDGGFMWGDGTNYGGSDQTSSVERGGTMGRSGAVQIRCVGDPGVVWGLNGIIFKYVPRRFR